MVKPLQVDHEDLREAVNRQIFFDVYLLFALGALEACVHHPFGLDKFVQAFGEFDIAEEANSFSGNLDGKVHEVVEGTVLKAARKALCSVNQLPFEKVCHNRVVSGFVVSCPLFALLVYR